YLNDVEKNKDSRKQIKKYLIFIGKIVDIIGPVKNPTIVVKLDKNSLEKQYSKETIFYYQKEGKKKGFKGKKKRS
ncbi:MAG: hypothetical protein ACFFE8_04770, partial [Candidatus Heimdallarchaeota archaeon]